MTRRGRPRKAGAREPNGRLVRRSQSREEADNKRVALEARARQLGVSPDKADNPRYSTQLGRLLAAGLITEAQFTAGEKYYQVARRFSLSIDGPRRDGAIDLNVVHGLVTLDEGEVETHAERAKQEYMAALMVVMGADLQNSRNQVSEAIAAVVLENKMAPSWLFDLRLGLSALVKHWGLGAVGGKVSERGRMVG